MRKVTKAVLVGATVAALATVAGVSLSADEVGPEVAKVVPAVVREYDDFDDLIDQSPDCWEDEVVVLVIWDPYGDLDENNTVGCVAADNLPVTGFRP